MKVAEEGRNGDTGNSMVGVESIRGEKGPKKGKGGKWERDERMKKRIKMQSGWIPRRFRPGLEVGCGRGRGRGWWGLVRVGRTVDRSWWW